jgi:uncharacterized cofD-like protein
MRDRGVRRRPAVPEVPSDAPAQPGHGPSAGNGAIVGAGRIAVLGGGHGLASVLGTLREAQHDLTVIVTVADDGGSSGELRRRGGGPAVGDLRRSLEALTSHDVALGRAFKRPLTIDRIGRHPLGNLLIRSLAAAFGDLARASEWLGEQLGISAVVLPATLEPVSLVAEVVGGLIYGESAIGAERAEIRRLRFDPERPHVPAGVVQAIEQADWVLLAPGSLFTSMLATSALPDVTSALARTNAHVVWICNLQPDAAETTGMAGSDHLAALRRHGVRVDTALYDPDTELHFESEQLASERVRPLPRSLQSERPGLHDHALLRSALNELFAEPTGERSTRLRLDRPL